MMRTGNSMSPLNAVVHCIGTGRSVPSRKTESAGMSSSLHGYCIR